MACSDTQIAAASAEGAGGGSIARRPRGRPDDGPWAHFERMRRAKALYEEVGAPQAAKRLGVSRQSIYNLVVEFERRLLAAKNSMVVLEEEFESEQKVWEHRVGVRRRQQRFRDKRTKAAPTTGAAKPQRRAGSSGARVPHFLRGQLDHAKAVRALCPTLMNAMRNDAAIRGAAFAGWSDRQVAQAVCSIMRWDFFDELVQVGRALCLHWRVRQNERGNWIPEIEPSNA